MQESSRQVLLSESKAELSRRRKRLLMSIISLVLKWSCSESAIPLEEFIEDIESTAKVGRRHPSDCLKLTASKVADSFRFSTRARNSTGKRCHGRNSKRRLELGLKHDKGGEGKRETHPERVTRANVQDRTKLGRTIGINLVCYHRLGKPKF